MRQRSHRAAEQAHEPVPGLNPANSRAGLIAVACAVDLTRGDARDPDPWTFRAPYRTVTIPNCYRSADEGLAGGHDGEGCENDHAD